MFNLAPLYGSLFSLSFVEGSWILLYDNTHHALLVGVYILIAVGAVMMFVGFLGCYGAIQESQCLLGTVSNKS